MANFKWLIDADHPGGHLVALTAEEETQLAADRAACAASAAADAVRDGNEDTVRASITTRMAKIRTARTALGNGTIFAGLSVNEKAVIDGLLEDDLYLGRIALGLFDGTN